MKSANVIPGMGRVILNRRTLKGMTQSDLAIAADVHQAAIAFIEGDKRSLPIRDLISIAAALGCTVDDLIPEKYLEKIRKNITQRIDNGNNAV